MVGSTSFFIVFSIIFWHETVREKEKTGTRIETDEDEYTHTNIFYIWRTIVSFGVQLFLWHWWRRTSVARFRRAMVMWTLVSIVIRVLRWQWMFIVLMRMTARRKVSCNHLGGTMTNILVIGRWRTWPPFSILFTVMIRCMTVMTFVFLMLSAFRWWWPRQRRIVSCQKKDKPLVCTEIVNGFDATPFSSSENETLIGMKI